VSAFKKFLVEFVRDKLFPNVAEFISLNMVQSRLNWFLDLVDYELMPIEPGKTKFSPEYHELKEKRSSKYESDTIVEVVSPGLQSKDGERVIQNAVVVQAE
jgi:molecular chaperone GrpE (heat shock protein)